MYWLAKSILHNDEDVKDAVQDSVLTAYENAAQPSLRRIHSSFYVWEKPYSSSSVVNSSTSPQSGHTMLPFSRVSSSKVITLPQAQVTS